jgi:hypothetical protein
MLFLIFVGFGLSLASHSESHFTRFPADVWTKESGARVDLGPPGSPDSTDVRNPLVIKLSSSALRMYYNGSDNFVSRVMSAISSDGGLTWTKEGVRLQGDAIDGSSSVACFSIVHLPNGSLRMYYDGRYRFDGDVPIFSAVSSDGLNWTKEGRINLVGTSVYDTFRADGAVVIETLDGRFRMFYRGLSSPAFSGGIHSRIVSAVSTDGRNWTREGGIRLNADCGDTFGVYDPFVVRLPDGTLKMYYTSAGSIDPAKGPTLSAVSHDDGLTWMKENVVRLPIGGHPNGLDNSAAAMASVIELPDGSFRMFYSGAPAGGPFRILSAQSPPSRITVGHNVNVSRLPGNQSEAAIAIDPTNPNNIVVFSNNNGCSNTLFKAVSMDGGATWTTSIIANGTDLPPACGDPSTASCFDSFGNLYLTYIDNVGKNVVVAVSIDCGKTFALLRQCPNLCPDPQRCPEYTFPGPADQPTITTGPGRSPGEISIWVTFLDSSCHIAAAGAAVTNLGIGSFCAPQEVLDSVGGNFADIAIGPEGQVLVTYQLPASGQEPANIYTNLDPDGLGPRVFESRILAATTNVGFDSIPAQPNRKITAEVGLAYDRSGGVHNGRVYLVYTNECPNGSDNTDIFVQFSDDNGMHWGTPVRVNNDRGTNSQFLPRIAVDQTTGNIAVSWHDCRSDCGTDSPGDTNGIPNDDAQFFATVSTDGGATFAPNVRVSAGTSNAANSGDPNEYGDYTGLAFHGGNLYPVWADNSNSTGDNPPGAALGQTSFDIYTARVIVGTVPLCATNVTNQVGVARGSFRFNRSTRRYVQTVTLNNVSDCPIQGPMSLVLDNLSSNAALFNATGYTNCVPPLDSPYINVNVGSDNVLSPGESVTVVLDFQNPSNRGITYNTRVLAGPGAR